MPVAEVVIEFGGENFLSPEATRAGLILLGSLLLSFLFIRTSARLMRSPKVSWWPGSVQTEGGLHVHHLVFGIVLLLLAGFVMALQPPSPWVEISAAAFGIGAGLTLDEYALWLHLEDVYWAEQGRRSVDAVVIAVMLGALVMMGFLPFATGGSAPVIILTALSVLAVSAVAVFKGKVFLGVAGVLFPLLATVAAIRLAKPDSPWARRRYPEGSPKLLKARRRYDRHARRYRRFQDRVAGAPTASEPQGGADPGGGPPA